MDSRISDYGNDSLSLFLLFDNDGYYFLVLGLGLGLGFNYFSSF